MAIPTWRSVPGLEGSLEKLAFDEAPAAVLCSPLLISLYWASDGEIHSHKHTNVGDLALGELVLNLGDMVKYECVTTHACFGAGFCCMIGGNVISLLQGSYRVNERPVTCVCTIHKTHSLQL